MQGTVAMLVREAIIESAQEITASKDGRVMVLDSDQSCLLFNVDGLNLANFSVNIQGDRYYRIACHPVVVAGEERKRDTPPDSRNIHCQWRL